MTTITGETTTYEDLKHILDKSFNQRRKDKRRAKLKNSIQKKEDSNTNQTEQPEVFKPTLDEKQRERFRKMGYVRRVKYLIEDVEELRKTVQANRKLIKDLDNKLDAVTNKEKPKVQKIKFNSQLLQKELLKFITYDKKEGFLIVVDGTVTRIEE